MPEHPNDAQNHENLLEEKMLDTAFQAVFHQVDCPDEMKLGEYQLNMLPEDERDQITHHLEVDRCPICAADLRDLEEFLADDIHDEITVNEIEGLGLKWLKKISGEIAIYVLDQLQTPSTPKMTPIPVMGASSTTQDKDELRRIKLSPTDIEDLDLEIVLRRSKSDPQLCSVEMQVEIPSRFPDLRGIHIQAEAGTWQAEGSTNEDGELFFEGLPIIFAEQLVIEVNSNS